MRSQVGGWGGAGRVGAMVRIPEQGGSVLGGVLVVLAAGFAASACLLTGVHLDDTGEGAGLRLATRVAWVLAAAALTFVGALGWWRLRRGARLPAALVGVASTAGWTLLATLAGLEPVR